MELEMARKQIKTVHLERQPHRDARQRLHLAYAYLIAESQTKKPHSHEEGKTQAYREVKL
jgi:hypothetical protein